MAIRCAECGTVYMDTEMHSCAAERAYRRRTRSYSDFVAHRAIVRGGTIAGALIGLMTGLWLSDVLGLPQLALIASSLAVALVFALTFLWVARAIVARIGGDAADLDLLRARPHDPPE